ncbi:hypothetical protein AURANDRAFT_21269, partial [Aureococcus anophagefferens]
GDVDAMPFLGEMYGNGLGVKLDKKKKERLYRMAADRGSAFAQYNLGTFLHFEEKFEEAFRYYVLAANQGHTEGEHGLGYCYRLGRGTEKAAKIYRRAVELGDVEAMRNLGFMYETGSGVKLDKKKAERLYRMAADRGDATAQFNLGAFLHAEAKFEEAIRYFVLAADQGLAAGEHGLGYCYRLGRGTEVDLGKARYWYARAAAKGYEKATRNLARLDAGL